MLKKAIYRFSTSEGRPRDYEEHHGAIRASEHFQSGITLDSNGRARIRFSIIAKSTTGKIFFEDSSNGGNLSGNLAFFHDCSSKDSETCIR